MYTSTVQSSPAFANAALSPHPRLQTSYPPSAHSISPSSVPPPPSLAPGFSSAPPASTPPPDSLRVLQWNAGGLRARSTELLRYLSSHPVDLICIQESNLNSSSSFRIPGFSALRSDRTHSRSGILSSDTTHSSGVVIFVRQGLSFFKLSTSALSSLDPYSDYVGINNSLNNSFSVSFLNVYAPPICSYPTDGRTYSFFPPFFPPPEICLFWGTSIATSLSGTPEFPPTPAGRKYLTGSILLTSSPSMTLTHPPFSIALPLTSPLLPPLLLFPAPGRCYRTLVLTIYQFFYLSLSLRSFAPTSVPLSSIFRKLAGMALPLILTHTVLQQRNTRLFLFPLLLLFLPLALNAAKSSIPFSRIKRPPKAWWSAEVEEAVSERCKAFAAAHRSDEDRQAYISASRRAWSVIAKAKTEAWQTTCSSLSHKSNPKSVHSLLRSIAGSPSSSSSSPNFPNCSSPRESASVYAAYLRSPFSVSQPKALRSRARGYLSEVRRATCSEESHSSFCSPFSLAEFLAAASNLSSSSATGPDKVAYPMLKHLPRSGMDFLLYIFNLSWSSHSFPSIWKTSSIIPIHKMGKPLDSPASFRPTSLISCVSKLFERIILSRLLFFLVSNSILSSRQAGFRPGRSTLDQILFLSQSISDGFNKPRPGSRTILSTIDFSKAFDSVWHPALFHKLILAGLPPCFARWTQSFLSDRRACVVFQNHKSRSFRVRRGVPQGSVLGPVLFSLFINDLPISLLSSVSCSLYADDLAIWSSSPSVPTAVEATQELCFDWSAGLSTVVFLSIRANVRPPSEWIPTRLTSNPTSSYSALASVLIPLQLFLGSPSTALFPFLSMYLR